MSKGIEIPPGREIAEGRYRVIGTVGEGSMGRVYRAYDHRLETEVVLKFPLPAGADLRGSDLLDRFAREIRSLVALGHPHIVRVIDAGHLDGSPYVVLQYLAGGSLRDRIDRHGVGMPVETLHDWLPEVARALDFMHGQGFIHRDVKPANILFDAHGNAFLGDFGIIKALASGVEPGPHSNSLTAPGFLMGTPSYVAPEIVMGTVEDGRSDQYSLGLTVHEVLTGRNVMAGPSPSATLVNQTRIAPAPLIEVLPQLPLRLSDAIDRALAKDPDQRFPTCAALAREVLADVPTIDGSAPGSTPPSGSFQTRASTTPSLARTVMARSAPEPGGVRRRVLLGAGLAGGVAALGGAATWLLGPGSPGRHGDESARAGGRPGENSTSPSPPAVSVTIAYGSEKKQWIEPAAAGFQRTPLGRSLALALLSKGSVEGAQAVLDGPGREPIHVWSPASSAYRDVFERAWIDKHGTSPIQEARDLALTPMVFVFWKSRYDAFLQKYGNVSFASIGQAMAEPRGWAAIADRPEWGSSFKFSHTDPHQSNSGLLTLVLMAYEFAGKQRDLRLADIASPEFRQWLTSFERNVARTSGGLIHSTGTLMEEMVKRGPSEFDAVLVYENLAIDFITAARERWGDEGALQVAYPDPNIWNGHPYYILDVPWSSREQRSAAKLFLDFLLSDAVQRSALKHGFRPGSAALGVNGPDSPLVQAESIGVRIKIPPTCEAPRAEVVTALLDDLSEGST